MAAGMKEMMMRHARAGSVAWIGLRPARRAHMIAAEACAVGLSGLEGDRGRKGKRAVTLIQEEHLAVIAALLGREVVPGVLRRNIVVSGINLAALRGEQLQIGSAVLELTVPCHPCSRMEEALGAGGYSAMREHGGMCAQVIQPGEIKLGDAVGLYRHANAPG